MIGRTDSRAHITVPSARGRPPSCAAIARPSKASSAGAAVPSCAIQRARSRSAGSPISPPGAAPNIRSALGLAVTTSPVSPISSTPSPSSSTTVR